MKRILTLFLILAGTAAFSQDVYLQKDYPTAEAEADSITEAYVHRLALSAKQELLFNKKVEEFLIRRYKIEEAYSGREKLDLLVALRRNEAAEIRDIITKPQYEFYMELRDSIQPLAELKQRN